MFDPLDLYTPDDISEETLVSSHVFQDVSKELENSKLANDKFLNTEAYIEEWGPLDVLDLPMPQLAPPMVILTTLKLLAPSTQVNFVQSDANLNADITNEQLTETSTWCSTFTPSAHISTNKDLCDRVAKLGTSGAHSQALQRYYLSILQSFQDKPKSKEITQIINECSLLIAQGCGRTAQPTIDRIFTFENQLSVKLHEPALTADNLGHKTWGSSFILGQRLLDVPYYENVLELGAGTGLSGLAYALSHKEANVTLTDLPEIVENLIFNIDSNLEQHNYEYPKDNINASVLDWTDHSTFHGRSIFDCIIVADPIYSENHPRWLVDTLKVFLKQNGFLYLCIPIRDKYSHERDELWNRLKEAGFIVINEGIETGKEDWGQVEYIYKELQLKI